MCPVVKLVMGLKSLDGGEEIAKRNVEHYMPSEWMSFIITVACMSGRSPLSHHFLCSFISLSCSQLARESYSLQSDGTLLSSALRWVGWCGCVCANTWGGVHQVAGNDPIYRYSFTATYITSRSLFFFASTFPFLVSQKLNLSGFLLSSSPAPSAVLYQACTKRVHLDRMAAISRVSYFILPQTCNKWQCSKSYNSYYVVLRHCIRPKRHSVLLKSTTSFVNVANNAASLEKLN